MPVGIYLYRKFKALVGMAGFNLIVTKKISTDTYESVLTVASYAPWLPDKEFNAAYTAIAGYTMVDKYRCYELWQLVAQTARLSGALLEVGVWRGGSGALFAKRARLSGIADTVYLCDTFAGVVKTGEKDTPRYFDGEHADTSAKTVEEVLAKLNVDNVKILTGIFPDETSTLISESTFRFCHVDVDVYQSAKDTVEWLWPKLVVGGIVVFDDYGFKGCDGVRKFVNEERGKADRVVIHNLNGHAIFIKTH